MTDWWTDRQTDRRTDGSALAYTALAKLCGALWNERTLAMAAMITTLYRHYYYWHSRVGVVMRSVASACVLVFVCVSVCLSRSSSDFWKHWPRQLIFGAQVHQNIKVNVVYEEHWVKITQEQKARLYVFSSSNFWCLYLQASFWNLEISSVHDAFKTELRDYLLLNIS